MADELDSDPQENSGPTLGRSYLEPAHGGRIYPWQPGQSGNPHGRPTKKTLIDALQDEVDREMWAIVKGQVKRAIKGDPRSFAEIRNTLYGVPKQTLEVQNPDDPQAALLAIVAQQLGILPPANVIEGESREVDET